MLAKNGGGTSQNFSNIRGMGSDISTGGFSNSVLDWVELYADMMSKTAQNSQRRGFVTAYLSVSHPEIMDFLDIGTKAMPKEKQRFFQTITTGVTLPIGWRDDLKSNPEKRKIFTKILNTRKEAGFPYIIDLENANNQRPQVYKDKGLYINSSNICTEVFGFADPLKTFVCCLSSANAYWFDDWKNHPTFLKDMRIMLDCVIEEFIEKAKGKSGFQKAVRYAEEHRSVGLGIIAFHSYLQKKSVVVGSLQCAAINTDIFKTLQEGALEGSKYMAEHFGEAPLMEGTGLRSDLDLAQAPTKSTAFLMGGEEMSFSEGVGIRTSNYNEKKLAKIQVEDKNKELLNVLELIGENTTETWSSIMGNNGSVQHLPFLSEHQKDVFKTFSEVSQVDIINMAAMRQKYIDQGQSINIMVHPDTPAKDIIKLHLDAFDMGIKSLYYQYSINAAQKFSQDLMQCSSCEG
jgi:ribonucleoside-diphosphate reductase alpha chain